MIGKFKNLLMKKSFKFVEHEKNKKKRNFEEKKIMEMENQILSQDCCIGKYSKTGLIYDKTYSLVAQAKETRILFGIPPERDIIQMHTYG